MIFDKIVTVQVRVQSGNYNNMTWIPASGIPAGVPMNIQPYRPEFNNMGNGMFYKTYKAFTTVAGIVEDMRLTVSGTNDQYLVRGVERYDYIVAPHFELILESATK